MIIKVLIILIIILIIIHVENEFVSKEKKEDIFTTAETVKVFYIGFVLGIILTNIIYLVKLT